MGEDLRAQARVATREVGRGSGVVAGRAPGRHRSKRAGHAQSRVVDRERDERPGAGEDEGRARRPSAGRPPPLAKNDRHGPPRRPSGRIQRRETPGHRSFGRRPSGSDGKAAGKGGRLAAASQAGERPLLPIARWTRTVADRSGAATGRSAATASGGAGRRPAPVLAPRGACWRAPLVRAEKIGLKASKNRGKGRREASSCPKRTGAAAGGRRCPPGAGRGRGAHHGAPVDRKGEFPVKKRRVEGEGGREGAEERPQLKLGVELKSGAVAVEDVIPPRRRHRPPVRRSSRFPFRPRRPCSRAFALPRRRRPAPGPFRRVRTSLASAFLSSLTRRRSRGVDGSQRPQAVARRRQPPPAPLSWTRRGR